MMDSDDPGPYFSQAERIRTDTGATAVLMLIIDGESGNGFQVVIEEGAEELRNRLPNILRDLADGMEEHGVA